MTMKTISPRLLLASLALMTPGVGMAQDTSTAIFAGGCFWCVEADFDKVAGVTSTVSGYIGGSAETANYPTVTADKTTGHFEAVAITYDPSVVTYEQLLTAFWHSVDPTDDGGQFCDRGPSYRTGIFTQTPEETAAAEASKAEVAAALDVDGPIVTEIVEGQTFYPAEDYHQDYYQNNGIQYDYYRFACGRDARVEQVWGDEAFMGISSPG
jgi:peptide-methionine (S)-S-oxide reductase